METLVILIKLLCAHLLSDFILQTDGINKGKRKPGIKGIVYQFVHATTHALAAYLFVAEWSCWLVPLIILVSHLAIDIIKCRKFDNTLPTFLADQLAHITVITLFWLVFYGAGAELPCLENICSTKVWLTVSAYILMLRPSSFS